MEKGRRQKKQRATTSQKEEEEEEEMNHRLFFIGLNRTGTSSLAKFFNINGYTTLHNSLWWYWRLEENFQQQVYTDGFEGHNSRGFVYPDLDFLEKTFPFAKYILNVRDLDSWMLSRLKHSMILDKMNERKGDAYSGLYQKTIGKQRGEWHHDLLLSWVTERNFWHAKAISHFKDSPKFLIINLEKEAKRNLREKLENFLEVSFDEKTIPWMNRIKKQKKDEQRTYVKNFLKKYVKEDSFKEDLIVRLKTV